MRISVIDIGTNTILLLIADIGADGRVRRVYDGHAIARLGKGVDEHGTIEQESFERVRKILAEYRRIIDRHGSEKIVACGTSALRDARNQKEFIDFIAGVSGLQIRILTGEKEAELTYRGAVSEFSREAQSGGFAVLDIGGGSTELTIGKGTTIQSRRSLDIGCVRLSERFLKTSPPSESGMEKALAGVRTALHAFPPLNKSSRLIGVAGTLTTLAAMDLQLPEYDPMRVSGHILTFSAISGIFQRLRGKTIEEMKAYPQILPGRADVLLAGIMILVETMKFLSANQIIVSDRGLRYGIALEESERIQR